MSGILMDAVYESAPDPAQADVIIVNTCGFIQSAKEEGIETIFDMAAHKIGRCKSLIVTGCLSSATASRCWPKCPRQTPLRAWGISGNSKYCGTHPCGGGFFPGRQALFLCAREAGNLLFAALCLPQGGRRLRQPLRLLRHSGHPGRLYQQADRRCACGSAGTCRLRLYRNHPHRAGHDTVRA